MKSMLLLSCCLSGAAMGAVTESAASPPVSVAAGSSAQADAAKLPFCSLTPDGSRLAVEPCRKAPQTVPRRSVMQVIARMPQQKAGASYGRPSAPAPIAARPLVAPPAPGPLSCGPAGCRDAAGQLHNAGPASVGGSSKLCSQNGTFLQCF
jgi:hypothetical protein